MSRPIRFRGWDTVHKNMTMDIQDDYSVGEWAKDPRFVLMQFTGLCDRNGKEIYEGDILKTSWYNEPLEVTYLEHEFILKVRGMVNYNYVGFDNFDNSQDFEVIGNIYENPVLLKGEGEDE